MFFLKRKDYQEQRFKHGERIKNSFGRTGTIIDGSYEVGEWACFLCWVYTIKWDDGQYETFSDRNYDSLTKIK